MDFWLGTLDLLNGRIDLRDCYLELFLGYCEHMFRFPSDVAPVAAEAFILVANGPRSWRMTGGERGWDGSKF